MTTTTKTSTSAVSVIAHGTSKAAAAQETGCSVARSGTTATLTKAGTNELTQFANGNLVWIRGSDIMEFNGIFTVANLNQSNGGNSTFTYTIRQDPGANGTGTPVTVDLAIVGTAQDNTTGFGAAVDVFLQNGGTGPTVAPSVLVGYADSNTEAEYLWQVVTQGHTVASTDASASFEVSSHRRHWNVAVAGNTAQAVDVFVRADKTASLATS